MICSECKKYPAIVFVSKSNSPNEKPVGYCFACAKELGIKPVTDIMDKMGLTDEDLEEIARIVNRKGE